MKFLRDRKAIAREINIKETPVITINVKECMKGYERCYEGDKVAVRTDNPEITINCQVKMYGDAENEGIENPYYYKKIQLMPEGVCLKKDFGYRDVIEMAEWRKAQRLSEGCEVIVIFDKGTECAIRQMRVGKVSKYVYPTAELEDIDE